MRYFIIVFFSFLSSALLSQDSLWTEEINMIQIQSSRIVVGKQKLPIAIATLDSDFLKESKHLTSLQDFLNPVSGVFALNQYNSAQDLRLSIRGFGARSAFGIRGVKMMVDGIPLTTPDGQSQVDNLWAGSIKNIEVIKGSSSALYGNASGGVVNLSTFDEDRFMYINSTVSYGSYDTWNSGLDLKLSFGKNSIYFQRNFRNTDGYRDHSASEDRISRFKYKRKFNKNHHLSYIISILNSPEGQDPGGIDLETLEENRRAARDRNIAFDAREVIRQQIHALQYHNQFHANWKITANGYINRRSFEGFLPFENGGAIDLDRNFAGGNAQVEYSKISGRWKNDIVLGGEIANQNDGRVRFLNENGIKGERTLDQDEIFRNFAGFLTFQSQYRALLLNSGIRYDENQIEVKDYFLLNGDASGSINMPVLSPSISLSLRLAPMNYVYGSYSFGFETPTLNELTNNPDNAGGLNTSLLPQASHNYEIGYKTNFKDKLDLGLTVFNIDSENELLPYELATQPGRTFFRNSGKTKRRGIEIDFTLKHNKKLMVMGSYAYSDFKFSEYFLDETDFSGNLIPGIPQHNAYLGLQLKIKKFVLQWNNRYISSIYLNNVNGVQDDAYLVGNLYVSRNIQFLFTKLKPFVSINNLYDASYNDNVRINAFGGRYYEPAPGINFNFGAKFEF